MQIEQRGRIDAVPAPRYKLTRAEILTVFSYRRWVAYPATPEGMLSTNPPHAALSSPPLGGLPSYI